MSDTLTLLQNSTMAIRAATDRRITESVGAPTQSAQDVLDEITKRGTEVQARILKSQQRLREWLATQPQSDVCPLHGCTRLIDFEASHVTQCDFARRARHTGPSDGEFFAEYVCPSCQRAATFGKFSKIGVPEKYLGADLNDLHYETVQCQKNLERIRVYQDNPKGFLVLVGNPGTGKSHAACAIIGHHGRGWFTTQSNLIDGHRKTYREREEPTVDVRAKAIRTPLLVIDEVGVATGGNDAHTLLYDVMNERYSHMRPTILTSNLAREEFLKALGPRIMDRINEAVFGIYRFDESSKRRQANEQYLNGIV